MPLTASHKYLELTTFLVFLVGSTAILLATYGPRLDLVPERTTGGNRHGHPPSTHTVQ